MANDVEILVTSRDRSGPGMQAATRNVDGFKKAGVSAGDAVGASMQRMADKVEASRLKLVKAQHAEADAFTRVRHAAAEHERQRLQDVPNVAKLTAAQDKLDAALRKVAVAHDQVKNAAGQASRAEKDFEDAGRKSGTAMVEGTVSTLRRLGPSLGPALLPAAALAGGAAGGALVLGFGAGIAGVGLLAAAQFGQVKDSYARLGQEIKTESKTIFEPFGQTALDIRAQISDTFDAFGPALTRASEKLAPRVSHFTGQLGKAFRELIPAVEPMAQASGRVLDSLGGRLPGVMTKVSRGMRELAESIEENPEALSDLVDGAGSAAEALLKLFAALNKGYTPVRESVSWLADLNDKIARLTGMDDPKLLWHSELEKVPPDAQSAAEALDTTAESAEDLAAAQEKAAKSAQDHARQLRAVTDAAYGQLSADIALRDAIDSSDESLTDYNEAVRDHGRRSEEASDALRDLESASLRVAEAARDNALAQQTAAGRSEDLVSANIAARDALSTMAAEARGPARDAILGQIAVLDALIARLRAVDGTFRARVQVTVSQTGRYSGPPTSAQFAFAHGGITGAAGGGPRSRQTLVGEHGPELVDLAPGSMVHPAGETQRMLADMAGGGSSTPQLYELHLSGSALMELLVEELQREIRNRGGQGRVFVA